MRDLLDHVRITNWYRLGLQLGISDTELDIIENDHKQDTEGALQKTFKLVLRRKNPDLTWENVVDALKRVGENKTARTIKHNFCRNP